MKSSVLLALAIVLALSPQETYAVPNCDCIAMDSCLVVCPGGDIQFNVYLYEDDNCQVPVVGFDCLRLNFSGADGVIPCPGDADWPYQYPNGPTDANGRTDFTLQLEGCSAGSQARLQVCGCPDLFIPCVKSLDVDMDGWVDEADIAYCDSLIGSDDCCCDFNCDGTVDSLDIDIMIEHRLHNCSGTPSCVPGLVSPADGATCLSTEVILDWSDVSGASAYEVQIGTSCGAGTIYGTTGSEKTVSGLVFDTEYHWRARAECLGEWGPWTSCRTFTTGPGPVGVPALTFPPNGETGLPPTVTLEWDCVPGAVGYQVQVGASCGTGTVYSATSCAKTISDLAYEGEYCWKVRAEDICGAWSDWSDCWCFQVCEYPNDFGKWALHFAGAHDAKLNTCDLQISDCGEVVVDGPATPGRYDVYVMAVDVDAIAGTRYGLECDGLFCFYGWTKCSDFEIPTDGWPGCDEGNAQTWVTEQGGPHVTIGILDVYVYGSSSLSTGPDPRTGFAEWCDGSAPEPICHSSAIPEVFGTVGFGQPGYISCQGDSCSAPELLSPPDESSCTATALTLDWSDVPGAINYEVQIGTGCGSGTTYDKAVSEKLVSGLAFGTEYFWRARAECWTGRGPWTECRSFTTLSSALGAPTLTSPADGAIGLPTTVTLKWDCVPGAAGYEIEVGAACFEGTIYTAAVCSVAVSGLDHYAEYCWRVRATDECGTWSNWSDCRCFQTRAQGPGPNINAKWALHYAGAHNAKANTCSLSVSRCEDVIVNAPSAPGRYDVYVIAVDVDAVAGTRYGLECDGSFYFYGWTKCSDFEIPTENWPGCYEGNAQTWVTEQAGPHVTIGILDVYVYGTSSLSTAPDPRTGFAEWCDGSSPEPICHETSVLEVFSTVGFGVPGVIYCEPPVSVGLAGFESRAVNEGILLEWTASDVSGFSHFFVHRSAVAPDGSYLKLSEKAVEPNGAGQGSYSYLDTDVVPGTLYYYKLEAIGRDGSSVLFGPYPVLAVEGSVRYSLGQNVPNPFKRGGETVIHYSVMEAGTVQIRILDVAGRLVKTITEEAGPGDNEVTWDGRNQSGRSVAGGVYFYEIKAGGFSAERKMMLVD